MIWRLVCFAALTLGAISPCPILADTKEDVAALIKQLKLLREPKPRIKVIEDLGKLGSDAKDASQALIETMIERNMSVRQAAAEALEKVNPLLQKPVLTILVDEQKRPAAIDELVGLQEEAKPAIPMLLALYKAELASQSSRSAPGPVGPQTVASKLLIAMTKIAPDDKVVLQTVMDAITYKSASGGAAKANSGSHPEVRFVAIELSLDLKMDVKLLTKAIVSATGDPYCRVRAIEALGELGPMAKDAIPALKKLKLDSDEKVRDAAGEALEKVEKQP
jgi:HEAT repeat protein